MNRKMIGEAIYIRVSDRKYNPIATKRGNVLTQSWRSKSAVFPMYHPLALNGYSNFINAVKRQRNLGLSTEQFAVQRNEHILTKIVQNKLFLQKCGIDTKL
jgi:hypothetical protein